MKKYFALLLTAATCAAGTVDITYTFTDFQGSISATAVRRATQTPLQPLADYNGAILVAAPRSIVTGTNGSCAFSNTIAGYAYRIELSTPYTTLVRTCGIPANVTGAINARDYLGDVKNGAFYYLYPVSNTVPALTALGFLTNGTTNATFNHSLKVGAVDDSEGIEIRRGTDLIWRFSAGNIYGYDGDDVAITIDSVGDIMALGGDAAFYRYFGGAAGLTNANASTLFGSGTIPAARLPSSLTNLSLYSGTKLSVDTAYRGLIGPDGVTVVAQWANGYLETPQGDQFLTGDSTIIASQISGTLGNPFDGELNTTTLKLVKRTAAPAPGVIGAGNGWLWVSNAVLYYSYTANGTTSNNAVKIAP